VEKEDHISRACIEGVTQEKKQYNENNQKNITKIMKVDDE